VKLHPASLYPCGLQRIGGTDEERWSQTLFLLKYPFTTQELTDSFQPGIRKMTQKWNCTADEVESRLRAQVRQAVGMPDIVIFTSQYIYIIEVKLDSTPEVALQQIEEKQMTGEKESYPDQNDQRGSLNRFPTNF
jgi:hypothetical protein